VLAREPEGPVQGVWDWVTPLYQWRYQECSSQHFQLLPSHHKKPRRIQTLQYTFVALSSITSYYHRRLLLLPAPTLSIATSYSCSISKSSTFKVPLGDQTLALRNDVEIGFVPPAMADGNGGQVAGLVGPGLHVVCSAHDAALAQEPHHCVVLDALAAWVMPRRGTVEFVEPVRSPGNLVFHLYPVISCYSYKHLSHLRRREGCDAVPVLEHLERCRKLQ
jgi:hypothetical protein